MSSIKLIADSGATKAEWCLVRDGKTRAIFTQGISPYFLTQEQIKELLLKELMPGLKKVEVGEVFLLWYWMCQPGKRTVGKKSAHAGFCRRTGRS